MKKLPLIILLIILIGIIGILFPNYDNIYMEDREASVLNQSVPELRSNSSSVVVEKDENIPVLLPAGDKVIEREFTWEYRGKYWIYKMQIPENIYSYYAGLKRVPMVDYNSFAVYATDEGQEQPVSSLAENFIQVTEQEGYTLKQSVEFVLAFIQSIEYVTDESSKGEIQYTRYPLETLIDLQGDCEDKSILYSTILKHMGIDTILVVLPGEPGHMAVGVKGQGLLGTFYEYKGQQYYYVETTDIGWKIGEIPTDYRNREAFLVPLVPQPLLIHECEFKVASNGNTEINVTVRNWGTDIAKDTRIYVYLDARDGNAYDQQWSDKTDLKPREKGTFTMNLMCPLNVDTRLNIKVLTNGYLIDESCSEWFSV